MKAEEIRKLKLIEDDRNGERIFRDEAFFLQEIAAQFADLNERIDGLMASMLQVAKAVNELNAQLRNPNPPSWWTGKAS